MRFHLKSNKGTRNLSNVVLKSMHNFHLIRPGPSRDRLFGRFAQNRKFKCTFFNLLKPPRSTPVAAENRALSLTLTVPRFGIIIKWFGVFNMTETANMSYK